MAFDTLEITNVYHIKYDIILTCILIKHVAFIYQTVFKVNLMPLVTYVNHLQVIGNFRSCQCVNAS